MPCVSFFHLISVVRDVVLKRWALWILQRGSAGHEDALARRARPEPINGWFEWP